jgi:hypothetical protein
MDAATISAVSALAGSFIGALASVATSWLTHHSQSRSERFKQEASRREKLFGAFVDQASQAYADGIIQQGLDNPARLVPLYSTINKLRLFATEGTVTAAEAILDVIIRTYEAPDAASKMQQEGVAAHDILRAFADSCRTELRELR